MLTSNALEQKFPATRTEIRVEQNSQGAYMCALKTQSFEVGIHEVQKINSKKKGLELVVLESSMFACETWEIIIFQDSPIWKVWI